MLICLAQLNFTIGDFEKNARKILKAIDDARFKGADMVVFSEMAVCGYPPDDLLDYKMFVDKCESTINEIATYSKGIEVLIGGVEKNKSGLGRSVYNTVFHLKDGEIVNRIQKTLLPSYDIFNEARYFEPAEHPKVIKSDVLDAAVTVCEDLWQEANEFEYITDIDGFLQKSGCNFLINLSASPFNQGKVEQREELLKEKAKRLGVPLVYVNQVGAHTEIIFDGGSLAINKGGEITARLPQFSEGIIYVDENGNPKHGISEPICVYESEIAQKHDAIVFGIREYFSKMNFKTAVLGSSGGIDSALVQALATIALGKENVNAVLMPSDFSSTGSIEDAKKLSENLGNNWNIVPIGKIYDGYVSTLEPIFSGKSFDITEENLQARARGMILMAISNKFGHILLNTSNKSEMAVGYSTLYGDMCGGLSPIGDVYKTDVYKLSEYVNRNGIVIPREIIEKAPSAELRPGQKDSDSLPDYNLLDSILEQYIEQQKSLSEITSMGFDKELAERVLKLINNSEYKRWQSPPILRVTTKAFGTGRRIPLVARYNF